MAQTATADAPPATAPETTARDVVVSGTRLPITQRARARFDQEQINLLYSAKAPANCPLPVFQGFLEIAARYDLDPFTGEIWLGDMRGRPVVMIGRDGYLKVARRDVDFIDVDADVVCENDEIDVHRHPDGRRTVEHRYGNPAQRGRVLGAFGILQRRGRPDRYFFAPIEEYERDAARTAWSFKHAMIIKAAISYVARITYGVSGAVPHDEVAAGIQNVIEGSVAGQVERTAPEAPRLPERLHGLVLRAAQVDPRAWTANSVAARIPPADDAGHARAVAELGDEIERWLDEHEVRDAVVVPDDEPTAADLDVVEAAAEQGPAAVESVAETAANGAAEPPANPTVDPFTAAMNAHDAAAAAGDADAVETTDVPAVLQARWTSTTAEDVEWREQVTVLLRRREKLEADACAGNVDIETAEVIDDEIRSVETDLDALGVPAGWEPADESPRADG